MRNVKTHNELRLLWGRDLGEPSSTTDYTLLADLGHAYAACSREGFPTLVVELSDIPAFAAGRRAAGFELVPHRALQFAHAGRQWTAPAAVLLCKDPELVDAFTVLAADVHSRLLASRPSWANIVSVVEEWQSLMAPRGRPSVEAEVGLWGELWLLVSSAAPDRLLAGWRGPDRDASDFFLDGRAAEVKTSRHRRQHHVSLSQVLEPVGDKRAWLLSLWVGIDPIRGRTVPALVDKILERVADPALALRRLLTAGYSPADRNAYEGSFVVLAEPEWYRVTDVPRVRAADPEVSRLRYVVSLDEGRCVPASEAKELWNHFLGHDYGART
ncbi:PD-(D/E)XK motif protein [Polyangium sp. y55x31]|uniref:PD-(D/E)XK motif protein n=1 Tax=Polyangium sp. y55x31 TaxID=3042688 RepID=UPI002483299F|nr:PD-(D/E)XK motif protein [Polyangium sp. y55x31]MDI1484349.1 PD-(D/E)XK motif protein [Polyangium sp. y55x31]